MDAVTRKQKIQSFCKKQKIERLIHFTRIENIPSILEYGLLDRITLESDDSGDICFFNDEKRLDFCENTVSLSISFPNYLMFFSYRIKFPQAKWAVLVLKPDVLWEEDCIFCHTNAASSISSKTSLAERRLPNAFERMFSNERANRKELNIPDSYPTDPQAEVLVRDGISIKHLLELYVDDLPSLQFTPSKDRKRVKINANKDSVKEYFTYRSDWEYWKKQKETE